MNKALITNCIPIIIFLFCYVLHPFYGSQVLINASLFAFSGAITNWLAIHMLFEKIPFVYGTGVITIHFEEFKTSIKKLIMEQFFTQENLDKFSDEQSSQITTKLILSKVQLDPVFDALSQIVMQSSLGQVLRMMGQENAVEQYRESFLSKIKEFIPQLIEQANLKSLILEDGDLINKIDGLVTAKLNELSPKMVKKIIEDMIRKHLGWLVVWGGVFGGLIGAISTFVI